MSLLPPRLSVFRFSQTVYVIADCEESAKLVVDANVSALSADKPTTDEELGFEENVAPLFIQEQYQELIENHSKCITNHDLTQVDNVNSFVRFIGSAFETASTFPVVPQLERSPAELIAVLIDYTVDSTKVCENIINYYFLRYPKLEGKLYFWNSEGGFSPKNLAINK